MFQLKRKKKILAKTGYHRIVKKQMHFSRNISNAHFICSLWPDNSDNSVFPYTRNRRGFF